MTLILLLAPGAGSAAPAVAGSKGATSRLMLMGMGLFLMVICG